MKSKRGQFNFVLLLALVAGAAILVLAIYGAIKAGNTIGQQNSAEVAKTLQIITDPLQAGFASASTSKIQFRTETRIFNDCDSYEDFGKNYISVTTKSSIGEKWSNETIPIAVPNKYIFSEYDEGKTFYVFSKPFELPFKVADLLFITSRDYCLVNPPDEISEELLGLNAKNIGVRNPYNDTCKDEATTVCFGFGNCNITVDGQCNGIGCESEYDYGYVKKNGDNLPYTKSLLYGAIFSEKALYNCNVERLLYRTNKIAIILSEKADLMTARGCSTLMKNDVDLLAEQTLNANPEDLRTLQEFANMIQERAEKEECGLW